MAIDTTELDKIIVGRVEPHIYAFSTGTIPNYLKVGDTYRPVTERLAEWEKIFQNLKQEYEGSAKIDDEVYFRDFSVHDYLENSKHFQRLLQGQFPTAYYSREFFKDATPNDVKEAIDDIRCDYANKTQRYQFYSAEKRLPITTKFARVDSYSPRHNQEVVINNFNNALAHHRTNLLMYAVMRFGKSFTSMCCAVEMGAKFVIVVSAKADVKNEWKRTVESHIKFVDYDFITSDDLKRNPYRISGILSSNKRVVCFLTLQDLQGKEIKKWHQEVFKNEIDLLLVDESHYGARAEEYGKVLRATNYTKDIKHEKANDDFVETNDADQIIKRLKAKITIHLSGTPYRILMGSEFKKEDIIAFVQFADIVKEQEQWNKTYLLDDSHKEWDNPYFGFPQMIRFAFHPNKSSRRLLDELKRSGITYAFSALLEPCSIKKDDKQGLHKKFRHKDEVLDLLEVIDGSQSDDELLGFLDYDKIKDGKMCRHIVVVLPYCASCDALEQLIKDNKSRFKNLNEYEIINISGVENQNLYKDTEAVKAAIRKFEEEAKKTITLTVNRMLTGSTVPEWDTMLYLKDTSSPQEYDQAIFRLQNQYIKTFVNASGETIKLNMKPQTLLVDFDPNRMFVMQEQKSLIYNVNVNIGGNSELGKRIQEDLRISPIITLNKDKIERVKAVDILTAISNYQKDKGIKEEALEIPVDMGILDDTRLREVIEKENEIGSRAGIATNAYTGEGDDDGKDMNTPSPAENAGNADTPEPSQNPNDKQNDKKKAEQVSLQKKIRSYYARILLYAFLTNDKVISLFDIIQTIATADNKRIAHNIGLSKSVLILINDKINKFVLNQLDYKIKDLNDLSRASNMTVDERTSVAISKFGKLGEAIVVTPSNICDDMVALLPDECFNSVVQNDTKILDIAGTAGEFAIALVKRMKVLGVNESIIKNSIYTIPKSKLCYELIRKVYEMLDLNIQNIAEQIEAIYIFADNSKIFEGVLLGSVNYFLYDNLYYGDTLFVSESKSVYRPLFEDGLDVIIPYDQMVNIVNKVRNHPGFKSLMTYTCGRDAFGISGKKESLEIQTVAEPFPNAVSVRCAYEQIRYIDRKNISKNLELVDKWKIFTSKGNGAAGTIDFNKQNAIIGKAYVATPNCACSDSLIPIGAFNTQIEAENLAKYMATKFLRFMVGVMKTSRNIYQVVYRFVPIQDFATNTSDAGQSDKIDWSKSIPEIDQQLYRKYDLSPEEIAFIEKMIKPME